MIEISSTNPHKDEKTKVKQKKKSQGIGPHSTSRSASFSETLRFEFSGTLDELMDSLKDQEKRFLDKQTPYELQRYKNLVQKILRTILNEGFQTESLKRCRRDRADFLVIKDIDQHLLALSRFITRRDNPAFNLLKSMEEIRGLLLNLLS